MARKLTVVVSQGQSAHPEKRRLEEDLVAALFGERNIEVAIVPHLYDLKPDGTGMLCLKGISGDLAVASWLFPRAAHWILARNGIRGKEGTTLLASGDDDEEDSDEDDDEGGAKKTALPAPRGIQADGKDLPNRFIYCLDLRTHSTAAPYVAELRRIAAELSPQVVGLGGGLGSWLKGSPKPEQVARYLNPTRDLSPTSPESIPTPAAAPLDGLSLAASAGGPVEVIEPLRINEEVGRRWYPVIDYSRCTNCMECIDFCLFGVYGLDVGQAILVEQPDNCKKGCPACSRVCPENAIIFPQHKSAGIAGSLTESAGGLKIDLSKLFGAPDALEVAAMERDRELVADGRDAVGMTVGIPKRQAPRSAEAPKDDLDALVDGLDDF